MAAASAVGTFKISSLLMDRFDSIALKLVR